MMNSKYLLYLILCPSMAVLNASCAQQASSTVAADTITTAVTAPAGEFSRVHNPSIPASMEFCGRKIDLDQIDYFERLDRELTSLTYTHGTTLLMIKRANRYFPLMAPILKENGIPSDLLYLACVESSLNPWAKSPAKAVGMWQFLATTAKEFGLEVGTEVDERYNIEKATRAACRYFKKALARYGGDWPSVMASYNAGMTRITDQLRDQDADDALELWLADETMRYTFRIMAMKMIMENPRQYGFILTADQLYQPREVDEVKVSGPVESWAKWAAEHGTTYKLLRDENPWIRAPKLTNKLGKTYTVRVPRKDSLRRSTAKSEVYNKVWVVR